MPDPLNRTRLSEHDLLDLMRACELRRDELVIGLIGLQGLRPRQLSWLLAGDVDLAEDTLTLVHADAPDPRRWPRAASEGDVVPLDPDVARALDGYFRRDRNAPRASADPVLTARPGVNTPITPDQVNHVVRKVSRAARGLLGKTFTVADLRWSCAKNLHERGVSPEEIAVRLGMPSGSAALRFLERGFE